jgi:fatty-acyl-CoA synthase
MTGLSIGWGPTDVPLLEHAIGEALSRAATAWPDGLALVSCHQRIRWSWSELESEADRIATGLLVRGVVKGDRVGIWAPNCAEWVVLQFVTAKIAAILVTINPAYRTSEVEYALNKVGCTVLVTAATFKSSNYLAMLREIGPERLPELRLIVVLGGETPDGAANWAALRLAPNRAALKAAAALVDRNDAINIQFTSGTAGLPKGATLTHRNILNNGYFAGRMLNLTDEDRI